MYLKNKIIKNQIRIVFKGHKKNDCYNAKNTNCKYLNIWFKEFNKNNFEREACYKIKRRNY
jgi:hypothetical protein